ADGLCERSRVDEACIGGQCTGTLAATCERRHDPRSALAEAPAYGAAHVAGADHRHAALVHRGTPLQVYSVSGRPTSSGSSACSASAFLAVRRRRGLESSPSALSGAGGSTDATSRSRPGDRLAARRAGGCAASAPFSSCSAGPFGAPSGGVSSGWAGTLVVRRRWGLPATASRTMGSLAPSGSWGFFGSSGTSLAAGAGSATPSAGSCPFATISAAAASSRCRRLRRLRRRSPRLGLDSRWTCERMPTRWQAGTTAPTPATRPLGPPVPDRRPEELGRTADHRLRITHDHQQLLGAGNGHVDPVGVVQEADGRTVVGADQGQDHGV